MNNKIWHLSVNGRISVCRMVRWMSTTPNCFLSNNACMFVLCLHSTQIHIMLSHPFDCWPFEWRRAYYKMKFYSKWSIVRPAQKCTEWMKIVSSRLQYETVCTMRASDLLFTRFLMHSHEYYQCSIGLNCAERFPVLRIWRLIALSILQKNRNREPKVFYWICYDSFRSDRKNHPLLNWFGRSWSSHNV